MDLDKPRCIVKTFVTSQFNYYPFVWIFHSMKLNDRINSIHERTWRLVYRNNKATFEELLGKNNSVTVHHTNLQLFATKIFKVRNDLAPDIMKEVFQFKNTTFNLRSEGNTFLSRKIRTTYHRLNSIQHFSPKIREKVPKDMKTCSSRKFFKQLIKTSVPNRCPCRLCKIYMAQV